MDDKTREVRETLDGCLFICLVTHVDALASQEAHVDCMFIVPHNFEHILILN